MTLSFQNEILLNYTESGSSPTPPPTPTYTYNVEGVGNNVVIDGKYATIENIVDSNPRTSYIKTKDAIINDIETANSWKISLVFQELGLERETFLTVFSAGAPEVESYDWQDFQTSYEHGALNLYMGTGSNWNLVQAQRPPASLFSSSPCWFVYELEFTGTQYTWKMKNLTALDTAFTSCWGANSTAKVARNTQTSTPYYLILGNNQFNFPNYGNYIRYDLSESYYTIDGTTTYLAVAQ